MHKEPEKELDHGYWQVLWADLEKSAQLHDV